VLPGPREDRQPKKVLFERAARWGIEQEACPPMFNNVNQLRTYIRNHWKVIRMLLPEQENKLPCYVNGATFGGGGGYRQGNIALARKQIERDAKVTDGVVSAANEFANRTVGLFPRIEANQRTLVSRRIGSR